LLAYAELVICIATVVLRLGDRLEVFRTITEDVMVARDVFATRLKRNTKEIRVLQKDLFFLAVSVSVRDPGFLVFVGTLYDQSTRSRHAYSKPLCGRFWLFQMRRSVQFEY
jgi:hypothetical protein